jgi:hypothetical protein
MNYSQDYEVEKVGLFSGHTGCLRKSDIEQQSRFLQERSTFTFKISILFVHA